MENSEKTAHVTPIFSAFKWSAGQFSQLVEILEIPPKKMEEKQKAKPNYQL